jgi:hypothetical protein
MNHLRFHRLLPASVVSLALVAATMTGGCNDEPSAQLAPDVPATLERSSTAPGAAPLASDDLREDEPLPPGAAVQPAADTADTAASVPPSFTQPQLESMVAPIALYPDPLLMQILMAATYPAEVVQAAAWVKENPGLNGKTLDDAIADKRWDVSVNSLTHAPKALELLAADTKWMQDLGDAFLAQQDDVLNAVQVMRVKACDLGNLKTTEQQKVVIEDRAAEPAPADSYVVPPPSRVVRIEPVQPEVVYVPQYNPQLVYGYAPPSYYYPTIYSYPYFTAVVAPVITFGVGLAIGGFLWGDCDWHHHHVYARPYYRDYYVGRYWWNGRYGGYNDFYRAGYARDYYWRHDIDHRRGVRYVNRDVDRYYSVRGRDPYRFRDDNYRYDRRKAARGDYDRMPGFRDSREASRDGSRDGFRDGDRDGSRDGGRGDTRDWRDKAREDARERMNRDSQARGERGPGSGAGATRDGDRGGMRDGDRGGNRGGSGKDSDRDSAVDRGGDRKGPSADRGGAKAPSVDRGGGKGSSGDRGKVDRPSGGGGRSGERGPSVKPGGGSSQRGGDSSSKGGSVQRGGSSSKGGSSKGGSVQRGGGSSQRSGGSSKGGSVQRGGSGGGGRPSGGSSMRQGGGGSSSKGGSVQRGGGGSSQRGGGSSQRSGGGSQGGRSGGSSKGGGGGDRGKGGGRN